MTGPTLPPPSLLGVVAALRTTDPRYPHVGPTDEEDDIAAVLEAIEEQHPAGADESDTGDWFGTWGDCGGCGEPWPCPEFIRGQHLALLYLGRAADRVHARAVATPTRSRPA